MIFLSVILTSFYLIAMIFRSLTKAEMLLYQQLSSNKEIEQTEIME